MVDTTFVMEQFKPIMLYMEALVSNADSAAYRTFDTDAMFMRLFEAANHYLCFELGRKRGNIGFDFYINEYFGEFAKYMNTNVEFLKTGGIYFANAVGYLTRCLDLARQRAEEVGAVVTDVESTPHNGWALFSYTVIGSFANHLYDFVPTPSVNY
jgi:hypothetical protein